MLLISNKLHSVSFSRQKHLVIYHSYFKKREKSIINEFFFTISHHNNIIFV